MNKLSLVLLISAGACTGTDYRSMTVPVSDTPARMADVTSGLIAPADCPIYTPNGGDIDTPELPFHAPYLFYCAVDSSGDTYGIVTGDTGDLAVTAGDREVGLFVAWDATVANRPLAPDHVGSAIKAYSAALDVDDPDPSSAGCCAEDQPGAEIPIGVVALDTTGMLLSFGKFDATATQVAITLDTGTLFPGYDAGFFGHITERFYVNAPPR